jgi:hypothetical protein
MGKREEERGAATKFRKLSQSIVIQEEGRRLSSGRAASKKNF